MEHAKSNGTASRRPAGTSSKHHSSPQTPYNRVCVVDERYIAPFNTDLVVDERSLSLISGDYDVTDVSGKPIFLVKGTLWTLHKNRTVYDVNRHNAILTMRANIMTAHQRWSVYCGDDDDDCNLLFTVCKSDMFQPLNTELFVYLSKNYSESVPDFRIEGSFMKRSCTIYVGRTNHIIAQMHNVLKIGTFLTGASRYAVTVYPNVDQAFVAALMVLLDEIK